MKKLKVLLTNNAIYDGGVETLLRDFVEYLLCREYDVTVAAYPHNRNDLFSAFDPKVHCVYSVLPRKNYPEHTIRWFINRCFCNTYEYLVRLYLSHQGFDVMLALKESWVTKQSASIRAKKKFAWMNSRRVDWSKKKKPCFASIEEERACLQKYDNIVCVSEDVRNSVIEVLGDPGNLCVRYNPINTQRILAMATEPCSVVHNSDKPLLVALGRLAPEKQYLKLIKVCTKIHETLDFDLWIIGDGAEREILEQHISNNNLSFVSLFGHKENPFPYLKQADVFVSSSYTEGFSLVIHEALTLKIPVVAIKCACYDEIFQPEWGILTENSDQALEEGLRVLLRSKDKREEYKKNIEKTFPIDALYTERMNEICALWE